MKSEKRAALEIRHTKRGGWELSHNRRSGAKTISFIVIGNASGCCLNPSKVQICILVRSVTSALNNDPYPTFLDNTM